MWAVAEPVTNFNNSLLLPPEPHVAVRSVGPVAMGLGDRADDRQFQF
ncbi:MAG: hypothetical protein QOK16_2494, partial [Solirubrobacteraceae bacterium]|nr:hypothetical protein [Solirubrobacteraceae bacterium]